MILPVLWSIANPPYGEQPPMQAFVSIIESTVIFEKPNQFPNLFQ